MYSYSGIGSIERTLTRQGIISKANKILQSGQVFEGPLKGTTDWFSVGSFSAEHPTKLLLKVLPARCLVTVKGGVHRNAVCML